MGNKCWGTLSTVELWVQNHCKSENRLGSQKCSALNQVIELTIHVQFVLPVKTFLMKKFYIYKNIRKKYSHRKNLTLQESVNHIMMNNQTETSIPIPNQVIIQPIHSSKPTKPASPMRTDAVTRVNLIIEILLTGESPVGTQGAIVYGPQLQTKLLINCDP